MLVLLRVMQIRWTRTWAEKGGRARSAMTGVAGERASARHTSSKRVAVRVAHDFR